MKIVDYQRLSRPFPCSPPSPLPASTVADGSAAHVQVSLLPRRLAVGRAIFLACPSGPESQRCPYDKPLAEVPALIALLRGANRRPQFVSPACQPVSPHRQLGGRATAETLQQGLREVLGRVHPTGGPCRNPVRIEPEGQPRTPLQAVYVDLTLRQFSEQSQPAGSMVFTVKTVDLMPFRAEQVKLRAWSTGGPAAAS